jgi:hypothetical protein
MFVRVLAGLPTRKLFQGFMTSCGSYHRTRSHWPSMEARRFGMYVSAGTSDVDSRFQPAWTLIWKEFITTFTDATALSIPYEAVTVPQPGAGCAVSRPSVSTEPMSVVQRKFAPAIGLSNCHRLWL